jgi:hypothetical protein
MVTMSTSTGLDRAVEYVEKVEKFRAAFQKADTAGRDTTDMVKVETGRKFDKVYVQTYTGNGQPLQKLGRYMIDRNSWVIYGIKSWAQINPRRTYGTLDTIDQYDWSHYYGKPKAGTDAEKLAEARENEIQQNYKPRGRPRKNP